MARLVLRSSGGAGGGGASGITFESGFSGSGTFATGQSLTINKSGGGFGAGPSIYVYDEFEGTPGNASLTATKGTWDSFGGNIPQYTTEVPARRGSTCALMTTTTGAMRQFFARFAPTTEFYISYCIRSNVAGSAINSGQCKFTWAMEDSSAHPGDGRYDMVWPSAVGGSFYIAGNDGYNVSGIPAACLPADTWTHFSAWGQDRGASAMGIWLRWDRPGATYIATTTSTGDPGSDETFFVGTSSTGFGAWNVGGFSNHSASHRVYYDDFYLALGARAKCRFETGESSGYNTSYNRVLCPHTSWADGTVTIDVQEGGAGRYLFWTDENLTTTLVGTG